MTVRPLAPKPTQRENVRFVDTNVPFYAISKDPAERAKAKRAVEILGSRDLGFSAQVLQEFYRQSTHERRSDRLTHERARALIESFRRFPVHDVTVALVLAATETEQRFQISYWDAAIIEAARALRCEVVLSEDLSDGQDYDGVRVENPFRDC
jgi:predicted nucleic acid-binding protein